MATLPALVPTDTVANGNWTDNASGTTNIWQEIEEGIAGAVDSSDFVMGSVGADQPASSQWLRVGFTDTPSDFVSMDTLSIQVRYAHVSRVDDILSIEAMVRMAAGTNLAYTSIGVPQEIVSSVTDTAFQNSSVVTFDIVNTTATKAEWDGAYIALAQRISNVMSSDNARVIISAVELTGTYTASASDVERSFGGIGAGSYVLSTSEVAMGGWIG